jgi:cellulose synthase operon protein C
MPFGHYRFGACCAAAFVAAAALLASPGSATAATEDSQSFVTDAKQRIEKGDLKGAEIQLRNAVRGDPDNPALHIELAGIYLQMQNLPAAEVEARLARSEKGPVDAIDPLLAQALLQENKFAELFRDVRPGNREAKAESQVRLALGLGHLQLQEMDQAEPLLNDAERLDDKAVGPKVALAEFFLAKPDLAAAQEEIAAVNAIAPDDVSAYRVEAMVMRAQGNVDGALAKLGALLAKQPNDLVALGIRADIFMSQNKLDQAKADIDRALTIGPDNPGVLFLDGLLLSRQGKLAEADAQLSHASVNFNNIPYGYYLQGLVKYQLGQYEQAAVSLSKYVVRFPTAVLPRRLLARIDLLKRDNIGAIDVLKPIVDANPADSASALLLAQAYIASGRRSDAIALYQRAADIKPNDIAAAADLAALQAASGHARQGLGELDKLAQTAEGAAIAGPALVIADLRTGRISDAAKAAEALVQRNGKDVAALSLLAATRMAEGRYADAAAIFKGMIDRDATLPAAQRGLAQADIALGKLDDAKSLMQGLVKQLPDSIPDVVTLAQISARQGDLTTAADLLTKAQLRIANNPSPGLALLQIYGDAKDYDRAQAYGRDLEGQYPANGAVIEAIAELRVAAGDAAGAAAEYGKLVQASPDSPGILLHYAVFQNAAKDIAGASASLRKAVSLSPHDPRLMQALVDFEMGANGPDAALAAAQSLAKNEPQMSKILSADVLAKSGHADQAIALLTDEQKDRPSGAVVAKLGEFLYVTGKHDEAKQLLQAWVKDHDDTAPRLTLANIYATEHADVAAQALYEQVRDTLPNDVQILNNLALIYAKQKDVRALDLAAQAYRLAPGPHIADTLGSVLVSSGRAQDGLALLRTASAVLPHDATISYHLAVALNALGQKKEALAVLEPVIKSGSAFDEKPDAQRLFDALEHG